MSIAHLSLHGNGALREITPAQGSEDMVEWTLNGCPTRGLEAMLAETDRQIAEEFRQQLERVISKFDLRVFGSRARGESSQYSDLDLFIVVPEITPGLRTIISEIAWRVGLEADVVVSTFVATYEQLETGAIGASPLLHAIEAEGVPV